MKKMLIMLGLIFTFATICNGGGIVYFDENGKPITKEKYEELLKNRTESGKEDKQDQYSESSYDSSGATTDGQGLDETKPDEKATNDNQSYRQPAQTIEYDDYGRPLYDSKGNMITYPYTVLAKRCKVCARDLPLATRDGELCPDCNAPWHWPETAKINKGGVSETGRK